MACTPLSPTPFVSNRKCFIFESVFSSCATCIAASSSTQLLSKNSACKAPLAHASQIFLTPMDEMSFVPNLSSRVCSVDRVSRSWAISEAPASPNWFMAKSNTLKLEAVRRAILSEIAPGSPMPLPAKNKPSSSRGFFLLIQLDNLRVLASPNSLKARSTFTGTSSSASYSSTDAGCGFTASTPDASFRTIRVLSFFVLTWIMPSAGGVATCVLNRRVYTRTG